MGGAQVWDLREKECSGTKITCPRCESDNVILASVKIDRINHEKAPSIDINLEPNFYFHMDSDPYPDNDSNDIFVGLRCQVCKSHRDFYVAFCQGENAASMRMRWFHYF
jgi:hypothetical protein